MNEAYMSNLYELESILMDVVRRRMKNGPSTSALTPIEMKAAETLVEIFKIKKEWFECEQYAGIKDYSWAVSGQIHETEEEPDDKTENKYYIVKALEKVLKLTRAGENVERLSYDSEHETVTIDFKNGYVQCVSVECDSGIAAIYDILKAF